MADNTTLVEQLYVAYFLRPADTEGLNYWVGRLNADPNNIYAISQAFAASAEYKATYAGMSNADIVQAVYHNLFGRAGEAEGAAYWTNLLDTHKLSIDNVVAAVSSAAQNSDKVTFNGRVSVATMFTQHLDQPNEVNAYASGAGNVIAKDYLSKIIDLGSGAAAVDPGQVDATIAKIVGQQTAVHDGHFVV